MDNSELAAIKAETDLRKKKGKEDEIEFVDDDLQEPEDEEISSSKDVNYDPLADDVEQETLADKLSSKIKPLPGKAAQKLKAYFGKRTPEQLKADREAAEKAAERAETEELYKEDVEYPEEIKKQPSKFEETLEKVGAKAKKTVKQIAKGTSKTLKPIVKELVEGGAEVGKRMGKGAAAIEAEEKRMPRKPLKEEPRTVMRQPEGADDFFVGAPRRGTGKGFNDDHFVKPFRGKPMRETPRKIMRQSKEAGDFFVSSKKKGAGKPYDDDMFVSSRRGGGNKPYDDDMFVSSRLKKGAGKPRDDDEFGMGSRMGKKPIKEEGKKPVRQIDEEDDYFISSKKKGQQPPRKEEKGRRGFGLGF